MINESKYVIYFMGSITYNNIRVTYYNIKTSINKYIYTTDEELLCKLIFIFVKIIYQTLKGFGQI